MRIVMISGSSYGQAPDLAKVLSRKLGWPVTNRDEVAEQARRQGIKMGRLEMAMIKTPRPAEKLAREKELWLAFATKTLCEQALESDFIYYGRAGHLLLPGVSHRLRTGVTSPRELRIQRAMSELKISSDRVENHLDLLDEDTGRWNRYVHHADGRDSSFYDLVLNLETLSLSNAASILCATAELPDFQPTPASTKLIDDHLLAARAKLRLALDERTRNSNLLVHADGGELTVAYPPNEEAVGGKICDVLEGLKNCRELVCIMADSTVLWVQERFEAESKGFEDITQLAQRWGAAVELLRLVPEGCSAAEGATSSGPSVAVPERSPDTDQTYDGGVEDDDPSFVEDDGGLHKTQERLMDLGRAGGQTAICGDDEQLIERVRGRGQYSLVVIGDLFLDKGEASRKRLTRELAMDIRDRLKAPVVTTDELRARWLFGKSQAVKLVVFAALVTLVYTLIFSNQESILNFLGGPVHDKARWLASVAVALVVPLIAYLYGTVSGLVLKMMNID